MFKYQISSNIILQIHTGKRLIDELSGVRLLSGKLMMLRRVENSSEVLKHNSLDIILINIFFYLHGKDT
jgi:hypothetical protein